MSKDSSQSHVAVALVDEGSNPFELACLTEVLGIDRPEVGGLLYDFRMCAADTKVRMRQGFFSMTGIADLAVLEQADTVIVPNRPDPLPRTAPTCCGRSHGRTHVERE